MSLKDTAESSVLLPMLAVSTAGHDKGRLYAVTAEDRDYYYLSDGIRKGLLSPKKKNKMHVRVIRHLSGEMTVLLAAVRTDSDLIHMLRVYKKETDDIADSTEGSKRILP